MTSASESDLFLMWPIVITMSFKQQCFTLMTACL